GDGGVGVQAGDLRGVEVGPGGPGAVIAVQIEVDIADLRGYMLEYGRVIKKCKVVSIGIVTDRSDSAIDQIDQHGLMVIPYINTQKRMTIGCSCNAANGYRTGEGDYHFTIGRIIDVDPNNALQPTILDIDSGKIILTIKFGKLPLADKPGGAQINDGACRHVALIKQTGKRVNPAQCIKDAIAGASNVIQ